MSFETITTEKKNVLSIVEGFSINKSFLCTDVVLVGNFVKLNTDGTVTGISAATQVPLGMVVAPNKVAGGRVTVQTNFQAIILGQADGIVAVGDQVTVTSNAGTGGLTKFKKAVATNVVMGVALTGGATTTAIYVGILRTPNVPDIAA